ncbi:MAG: peptidoglycan DD-metalloendopeptidase family protein [Gallionellaceae bacterium]
MRLKTSDFVGVLIAVALSACASSVNRAPISDLRSAQKKPAASPVTLSGKQKPGEPDWRPQVYVVQKGDTLYAIAFNYGLDYHEIADLNNIQNPDVIKVGQELRLFAASDVISVKPAPPETQGAVVSKPLPESKPGEEVKPAGIPVISGPLAVKLPYSAEAAEQIAKMQGAVAQPAAVVAAKAEPSRSPESRPVAPPVAASAPDTADDAIEWGMPTSGKIIAEYSESENRKGIDVAGKIGQPILASAAGKVVYSGSGLRGYGKLIIIKHNQTYLSAYAHNDRILVKEGQTVTKGQKIAEMGNSDADHVELHFEIRKLGKPVDPAKYLPMLKS